MVRHLFRVSSILFVVLAGLLAAAAASDARAEDRTVRVRLLELNVPREVTATAQGADLDLYAGDFADPILTLAAGTRAVIRVSNEQLHVEVEGRGLFAQSLRLRPAADGLVRVAVTQGRSEAGPFDYAGELHIAPDAEEVGVLHLVNALGLEDYVAAVVAREYGFDDGEGVKAMAVVARTYALNSLGRKGDGYDHVDHTLSQAYQGTGRITPAVREAVRATRGQVLTYRGAPIEAVYSSSSGGHTADNEDVWASEPLPYLRGKPDPYDRASPHTRWRSTVSRPALLARLSDHYGFEVTGFYVGDQNAHERVRTVELRRTDGTRHAVRAHDFRLIVMDAFGMEALKSTHFSARRTGDTYVFEGRGFGHGVGLSQWGAHEMAQRGRNYEEILNYYYTGVALQPMDHMATPSTRVAEAAAGSREPAAPTRRRDAPPSTPGAVTASDQPAVAPAAQIGSVADAEASDGTGSHPSGTAAPGRQASASAEQPPPKPTRRIGW